MNLNLTEVLLDNKTIDREVTFEADALHFSFGTFPITEKSPARIRVQMDQKKVLQIHGEMQMTVTIPCSRCLEDVSVPLVLDFEERIPTGGAEDPAAADHTSDEPSEGGSAFEPDYCFKGYHLDVDKLLFGEALLNWPTRVLCRDDCKGMCPVCGMNLNHGTCGCSRETLDPRMAKVLDVFNQFKEV